MSKFNTFIKRGITDRKPRQLTINELYIQFENKKFSQNRFTVFRKDEITDYKFGIFWIKYMFIFGREYRIFIKTANNEVLKINFSTYFRYRVKHYHKQYSEILDALWNFYFNDIISGYIKQHENGETFKINTVTFSTEGITITTAISLKQKECFIAWENIRTKNYSRYFAIYSIEDTRNINAAYNYMEDWNTGVIYSVLRTLLREKEIETYTK